MLLDKSYVVYADGARAMDRVESEVEIFDVDEIYSGELCQIDADLAPI